MFSAMRILCALLALSSRFFSSLSRASSRRAARRHFSESLVGARMSASRCAESEGPNFLPPDPGLFPFVISFPDDPRLAPAVEVNGETMSPRLPSPVAPPLSPPPPPPPPPPFPPCLIITPSFFHCSKLVAVFDRALPAATCWRLGASGLPPRFCSGEPPRE